MENINKNKNNTLNSLRLKQLIIRFLSALAILILTSFFTINFNTSSYPKLVLSAISIVVLDYFVSTISGIHDIPIYRSIVGFVASTIIVYMTQFFVPGFYISIATAIIASLMYGIIQYILPNKE